MNMTFNNSNCGLDLPWRGGRIDEMQRPKIYENVVLLS